jgi:hypothetical protein
MDPARPRTPDQGWELDLGVPTEGGGPGEVDDPEVSGTTGRTARRTWLTVAVLVPVLVLALAGWSWDQNRRSKELDALLGCVTAGQASTAAADARVSGITEYVRPSLGRGLPESTTAGLYLLIGRAAEQALPGLQQAVVGCRQVSVLRWHGDLRTARQAYLDHLDGQVAAIRAIADHPAVLPDDAARLSELSGRARSALLAAAGAGTTADRLRATTGW